MWPSSSSRFRLCRAEVDYQRVPHLISGAAEAVIISKCCNPGVEIGFIIDRRARSGPLTFYTLNLPIYENLFLFSFRCDCCLDAFCVCQSTEDDDLWSCDRYDSQEHSGGGG